MTLLLGFGAFALADSDMTEMVRLCVMMGKHAAGWAVVQGATPVEVVGAIRQKDELAGSAFGVAAVWAETLRVRSQRNASITVRRLRAMREEERCRNPQGKLRELEVEVDDDGGCPNMA